MSARTGARIIGVLEQAGERYLGAAEPRRYSTFLLQIGGTNLLREYEASQAYWERVQAVLDTFFTSAERAEICARLIDRPELRARPEFRAFLSRALAERRMQELIGSAVIASSATRRSPLAAVRRGR